MAAGSRLMEKRSCSHERRSSLSRIFLWIRDTWKSEEKSCADCEGEGRGREGRGEEGQSYFAPFLLLTRRCYDAETNAILLL